MWFIAGNWLGRSEHRVTARRTIRQHYLTLYTAITGYITSMTIDHYRIYYLHTLDILAGNNGHFTERAQGVA